jgi:D-alanine-D-alanine ligase
MKVMSRKIRVGVIFGGKSAEHQVSLLSAKSVIDALDKSKYEVIPIAIDQSGQWHLCDDERFIIHAEHPGRVSFCSAQGNIALAQEERELISLKTPALRKSVDVIFPVLHGTYGEDGTIQGLLKLANIPFVGAGVLGSALGMDKDVMKRLLRDAHIPTARFLTMTSSSLSKGTFDSARATLGLPLFVKPANLGSSVGISKVKEESEWNKALSSAFEYDNKVIVEEYIEGQEIECAVLGNENPIASLPAEVIPQHEFYTYEAKYIDEEGALFKIPADLAPEIVTAIQEMAITAYKALCCEGMARVDFFLKKTGELFVSEINTIPGFTKISMYPKMWAASGLRYEELLDRLIQLAIERFHREQSLKVSY